MLTSGRTDVARGATGGHRQLRGSNGEVAHVRPLIHAAEDKSLEESRRFGEFLRTYTRTGGVFILLDKLQNHKNDYREWSNSWFSSKYCSLYSNEFGDSLV